MSPFNSKIDRVNSSEEEKKSVEQIEEEEQKVSEKDDMSELSYDENDL